MSKSLSIFVKIMETRQKCKKLLLNRGINLPISNSTVATKSTSPKTKTSGQSKLAKKSTCTQPQSTKTTNSKRKTTKTPNENAEPKKLQRSKSFERYGVVLPKYEDVLDDFKKIEEYEKKVNNLVKLQGLDEELSYNLGDEKLKKERRKTYLDCEHLTLQQIEKSFEQHKKVLDGILHGKIVSQRHQQFYKNNRTGLIYNADSIIVFNQEQRLHMLDLLHKAFDSSNRLINYFLKVLLPELCLLIFSETYGMNRQEAEKYIEDRPLS